MHGIPRPHDGVKVEQHFTGAELERRLAAATKTESALLDHDLRAGRIRLDRLTGAQSRALTGVSRGYQCTLAGLEPHERMRLRNGWATISEYHNRRTVSDRQIERYLQRIGIDRVYDIFERLLEMRTRPMQIAAE
jgi:hypothetical protein